VLDIVRGRLGNALVGQGDAGRHLLRLQAGVAPDSGDHGNVDGGKDIGGRAQDRQHTHQKNQNRQDQEGIRPL